MNKLNNKTIGILGATGIVGRKMAEVLFERYSDLNSENVFLAASDSSVGKKIPGIIKELKDHFCLSKENLLKIKPDFILMSAGGKVSKKWAKQYASNGTIVIDNSSTWRRSTGVPLVVPGITKWKQAEFKLIANPNCVAIMVATVLFNPVRSLDITSIDATVFQSVSGAGQHGLDALEIEHATGRRSKDSPFKEPIRANILELPEESKKVRYEVKKILDYSIDVNATCYRVPIEQGHSAHVHLRGPGLELIKVIDQLRQTPGIVYHNQHVGPLKSIGKDYVFVSNVKQKEIGHVEFFCTSDNLRVGAASNAISILQEILN